MPRRSVYRRLPLRMWKRDASYSARQTPTTCGAQATESISPELVLVSPDLARAARDALPDQPWELLRRPRETRHEPGRGVDHPPRAASAGSGSARWLARVAVVLTALVSLIVSGLPAIFVLGPRPTLEPASANARSVEDTATQPSVSASVASTRATARIPDPTSRKVTTGLFYTGSVGLFLVGRGGREIESFEVDACGLAGRVGPIPITPTGTFAFRGAVGAGRLAISGQFVAPDRSRGIVSGPTCTSRIRFGARR